MTDETIRVLLWLRFLLLLAGLVVVVGIIGHIAYKEWRLGRGR